MCYLNSPCYHGFFESCRISGHSPLPVNIMHLSTFYIQIKTIMRYELVIVFFSIQTRHCNLWFTADPESVGSVEVCGFSLNASSCLLDFWIVPWFDDCGSLCSFQSPIYFQTEGEEMKLSSYSYLDRLCPLFYFSLLCTSFHCIKPPFILHLSTSPLPIFPTHLQKPQNTYRIWLENKHTIPVSSSGSSTHLLFTSYCVCVCLKLNKGNSSFLESTGRTQQHLKWAHSAILYFSLN